jgi:phosphoserine phosphatase RsbU/P
VASVARPKGTNGDQPKEATGHVSESSFTNRDATDSAEQGLHLVDASGTDRAVSDPWEVSGTQPSRARTSTNGKSHTSGRESAEERLREIQSIMDAALHHLDVDELLIALLDRVLEILSSDTAAVLLLDDSRQLQARAARGVEDEVRQNVRIPIGRGFAGRIAAERLPLTLDRVDATTVANPILWEKGIKVMLGVPLVAGGQLLGVLHVGRFTEQSFGPPEIELLEMVAGQVASAVQTSTLSAERTAARVLQRSLLPTALPHSPHLRLASRYLPAERGGVGGDWYDAFSLPSGEFWVMTGDVGGHGLRPAVVMGRLRSALRAYAFEGWPAEKVLHLADQKLQHFEKGATATVACAVFSPQFDHFHVALAGHPPPVLAVPGQASKLLGITPAPLFGVTTCAGPSATRFDMPPDGVLVLYTDGLIERRHEPLDQGFERLRSVVTPDDPEVVCRRVINALIGDSSPEDDVALLALQRHSRSPERAARAFDGQ